MLHDRLFRADFRHWRFRLSNRALHTQLFAWLSTALSAGIPASNSCCNASKARFMSFTDAVTTVLSVAWVLLHGRAGSCLAGSITGGHPTWTCFASHRKPCCLLPAHSHMVSASDASPQPGAVMVLITALHENLEPPMACCLPGCMLSLQRKACL